MKWGELRPGLTVRDRWWPWHFGTVKEIRKTFALILQSDGVLVKYDRAHVQFLEPEQR